MIEWVDEKEFRIGDTSFRCAILDRFRSTPDRFLLVKPRPMVETYVELLARLEPRRIVEVGIYEGGSTALFATLTRPEKLVAIDHATEPNAALAAFLDAHGFGATVRPHYGIDQADRARIRAIVSEEFGEARIDLVIDDASHLVEESRSTFNTLFPLLRPGGVYVLEDWSWAHVDAPFGLGVVHTDKVPLTVFLFEVVLACGSTNGLIADITIERSWAAIRRGEHEIDPETFDVSITYTDRGRSLVPDL